MPELGIRHGFFLGLLVWLAAFIVGVMVAQDAARTVSGITGLLLLAVALILFFRYRESPLAIGVLIPVCIGLLVSAACAIANPGIID